MSRDAWSVSDTTVYHPYVYARNNPASVIDPSGHSGCQDPDDPNDALDCPQLVGPGNASIEDTAGQGPTEAQIAAANAAETDAAAAGESGVERPGSTSAEGTETATLDLSSATRLTPNEISTAERLAALPQMAGRTLTESPHEGAELADDQGRSYDLMGQPQASKHWNESEFLGSINSRLLKENDFSVIDLTGFTADQVDTVRDYVDSLPQEDQDKIIRIGF